MRSGMLRVNKLLDHISLEQGFSGSKALRIFAKVQTKDPRGRIVDTLEFECHSFVANFLRLLNRCMVGQRSYEIEDMSGALSTGGKTYDLTHEITSVPLSGKIFDVTADVGTLLTQSYFGPLIGLGTTIPTPNDTCMEKLLCHSSETGTKSPNSSLYTGTATGGAVHIMDDSSKSWSTGDLRNCILEATSGVDNGKRRYIGDNTSTRIFCSSSDFPGQEEEVFEWDASWGTTLADYKIFTWGQVAFDSNVTVGAIVDNGSDTVSMTISRTYDNDSGSDYTITEFGLAVRASTSTTAVVNESGRSILIARDVNASPGLSLINGFSLTLTYTIVTVL